MAWYSRVAEVRTGGKGQIAPEASVLYMYNNKFYIYIADMTGREVLLFHPYLKSVNISISSEIKDQNESTFSTGASYTVTKGTINYSIEVDMPAVDIEEAKVNAERVRKFINMLTPVRMAPNRS